MQPDRRRHEAECKSSSARSDAAEKRAEPYKADRFVTESGQHSISAGSAADHRCMPQRLTVRASMARKNTDSTTRPIRITARSPEKTVAVSRSFLASKMYQPIPPERAETPNTSSAATSVRQAKAHPILRPARIDGKAAGIRMSPT